MVPPRRLASAVHAGQAPCHDQRCPAEPASRPVGGCGDDRPHPRGRAAGRRLGAARGRAAARYEAAMVSGRPADYLFGQSAGEAERLRLQARMFAPYTARFLQDAGISPGMKVRDVGTGAATWRCSAAGLAGREGAVVGIDFNAELIAAARARAAAAGMGNVSFADDPSPQPSTGPAESPVPGRLACPASWPGRPGRSKLAAPPRAAGRQGTDGWPGGGIQRAGLRPSPVRVIAQGRVQADRDGQPEAARPGPLAVRAGGLPRPGGPSAHARRCR